jgi:hypothetical protein
MEMEKLAGYIAVAWLIGAMLLLMRLVRRGRQLAADLAARHPETYEFEDYRQAEARLLIVLLASLGVVGFLILAVRYAV